MYSPVSFEFVKNSGGRVNFDKLEQERGTMPDKVIYMGLLGLLLAATGFCVIAAPQFNSNVSLAMALLATGFALAIDMVFFPDSFWMTDSGSASKVAIAGLFLYGSIVFFAVNAGYHWRMRRFPHLYEGRVIN
ncbi:MAG: hypothetical protein Q7T74_05020 [Candidatus Saccharibacteria bacterium]|nr:hypothetical protein [Candidatus Saccharibacteria bacterium]